MGLGSDEQNYTLLKKEICVWHSSNSSWNLPICKYCEQFQVWFIVFFYNPWSKLIFLFKWAYIGRWVTLAVHQWGLNHGSYSDINLSCWPIH